MATPERMTGTIEAVSPVSMVEAEAKARIVGHSTDTEPPNDQEREDPAHEHPE